MVAQPDTVLTSRKHVDLFIGMVPIVNLEDPEIRPDTRSGHFSRSGDGFYCSLNGWLLNYITPQFSRTHINFRCPLP